MRRRRWLTLFLAFAALGTGACYPPPEEMDSRKPLEISSGPLVLDEDGQLRHVSGFLLSQGTGGNDFGTWRLDGQLHYQYDNVNTVSQNVFGIDQRTYSFGDNIFTSANDNWDLVAFGGAPGGTQRFVVDETSLWASTQAAQIQLPDHYQQAFVGGFNLNNRYIDYYASGLIDPDSGASYDGGMSTWEWIHKIESTPGNDLASAFDGGPRWALAASDNGDDLVTFYTNLQGQRRVNWLHDRLLQFDEDIDLVDLGGNVDEAVADFSELTGIAYSIRKTPDVRVRADIAYSYGDRLTLELGNLAGTTGFQSLTAVENQPGMVDIFAAGPQFSVGEGWELYHWVLNLFTLEALDVHDVTTSEAFVDVGPFAASPFPPAALFALDGNLSLGGIYGALIFFADVERAFHRMFCVALINEEIRFDGFTHYAQEFEVETKVLFDVPFNFSREPGETESRTPRAAMEPARALQISNDTAAWYFFEQDNIELITKVIDACKSTGFYWFFAGGLTNLEVEIQLKDRNTGKVKTYTNKGGEAFQPIQDGRAFPCKASKRDKKPLWRKAKVVARNGEIFGPRPASVDAASALPASGPAWAPSLPIDLPTSLRPVELAALHLPSVPDAADPEAPGDDAQAAICTPNRQRICLLDGRFRVRADWETDKGQSGRARAQPLGDDSGYFYFFEAANVELQIKMVDGCKKFDRFWVFAGGLTDVAVDLEVTDTMTGKTKVYKNPQGTPYQPVQDVKTFACS